MVEYVNLRTMAGRLRMVRACSGANQDTTIVSAIGPVDRIVFRPLQLLMICSLDAFLLNPSCSIPERKSLSPIQGNET